tara:strand:- start:117 stop:431 length:315 start_codon:yes stop_codon:yes gene_type:complete
MAAAPGSSLPVDAAGAKVYSLKVLANAKVAYDASATITLDGDTLSLIAVSTTDCHINFDGAATTSHLLLPANTPLEFHVFEHTDIRAIKNTTAGDLHVMEFGLT